MKKYEQEVGMFYKTAECVIRETDRQLIVEYLPAIEKMIVNATLLSLLKETLYSGREIKIEEVT